MSNSERDVNKLVYLGKADSVQKLINSGADPDGRFKGVPHIIAAARAGRTRVVKVLLRAGANIDALDDAKKGTALGYAAYALHNDTVTALTEAGARLKDVEVDKYAIHGATTAQNLGIVEELVSVGADLDVGFPDDQNRTALHLAVAHGMTLVAQVLLRAGSNVNQTDESGCTPLYSAAYVGHLQCAVELLKFGADMLIMNNDGNSALEASSQEGHAAIVEELLRHGVLRSPPRSTAAWVAFAALCAAARSGQMKTADVLLRAGVPPVQEGIHRSGPLSCAARAGHLAVARRILKTSGTVDERDSHGCTPLIRASEALQPRLVAFLLASGADYTIRSSCGCDKDALMSIGESMGLDPAAEERPEAQIISAKLATRRVLLRGVAYRAISWAWPTGSLGLTKHRGRKDVTASVRGGVVSVVWGREQQRRRQAVLSAMSRHAGKPEPKTKHKRQLTMCKLH